MSSMVRASGPSYRPITLCTVLLVASLVGAGVVTGQGDQAPARSADGTLILEDPVGDVGFTDGMEDASSTFYSQIDITSLTIGPERPDRFHFFLDLAPRDATGATVGEALALNDVRCELSWGYDSVERQDIRLTWGTTLTRTPGADYPEDGYDEETYVYYRDGDRGTGRYTYGGFDARYDAERVGFALEVPYQTMLVMPDERRPAHGDGMNEIQGRCRADIGAFFSVSDRVYGGDHTFAFTTLGAGQQVSVHFADDPAVADDNESDPYDAPGLGTLSVGPGHQSAIPLLLVNHAEGQRVAGLRAELEGAGADTWNVTLPDALLLRGGERRTVNLFVTPPTDAVWGAEHSLKVTLALAGQGDHGQASRLLAVEPVLGVHGTRFHFHTDAPADGESSLTTYTDVAANLLEEDARWSDGPIGISVFSSVYEYVELTSPAAPVVLDPDGVVEGQFRLDADFPAVAQVYLYVYGEEVGTIASYAGRVPTGEDFAFSVPVAVAEDENRLAPGARLDAWIEIYPRLSPDGVAPELRWDPTQSWFDLPLVAVQQETVVTDGNFQPNLQVAPTEDPFVYLNPGDEYAFDLNLSNDGRKTDDLTVTTEATVGDVSDWTLDVLPGRSYRVQPGNGTPVTVRVVVPADAAEGDRVELNVTAVSKHDAVARSTVKLTVVVTNGVPIEGKAYEEKDGQLEALSDTEESAGPAAWLLVGLALALARRRRS